MSVNLERIKAALKEGKFGTQGVLLTSPIGRKFASGFSSSAGMMIISAEKSRFITDFRYYEAACAAIDGAEVVMIPRGEKYSDYVNVFIGETGITTLAFEDREVTYALFSELSASLGVKLIPMGGALSYLRASKQEFELEAMRKAQKLTEKAFAKTLEVIRAGMAEKEVKSELIYNLYLSGAEGLSFDPIIVSGPNGSLPHGQASDAKICNGEFLTMDFGAIYQGYCSDMTRTVAIGKPSAEMTKVYEIVLEAQKIGLERARAGIAWADVDAAARKYISDRGYGEYFGHGLGHALGLEVHEPLDFSSEEPGITPVNGVVSVEPGIYLPGKFGVRIEDCVILKEGGCENLTSAPKELIIL